MAVYLVGDIQGCDAALQRLLVEIGFSPGKDMLYVLGDLVNRGPDSPAVLRRLMNLGDAVQCVLGNHDLHALAVACGVRRPSRMDTLDLLLSAEDRDTLLQWLRRQSMAIWAHDVLMVHAGVLPQWSVAQTLALAQEVQDVLRGPGWVHFLREMYGNHPSAWDEGLAGVERLRVIVNALTRLRFCTAQGEMEFETKDGARSAPAGCMPWFEVPDRSSAAQTIAFGHWSTLGWIEHPRLLSLDTGCVWGGCLTALELRHGHPGGHRRVQVRCEAAQKPSP